MRGRTRFAEGRWEVREGARWRALDPGDVSAFKSERELEREAERLAAEIGRDEHTQRVALADWMVREGLAEEALAALDRVLAAEPDHDAALALIARAPFRLPYLGDASADEAGVRGRLFALAAQTSSPTRRELAVNRLRALPDREALREALRGELVSLQPGRRSIAALALRRIAPGQEVRELLLRAALDRSSQVRREAALALRATGEPGVVVPLVRALGSESGAVRINAAESLGHAGFEAAVPALVHHMADMAGAAQGGGGPRPPGGHVSIGSQVAYVSDFDVEIAQGASIADPIVNVVTSGVVLEARSYGMQEYTYVTELRTVRRSLKLLTGHDAGNKAEKWQAWLEQNASRSTPDTPGGD